MLCTEGQPFGENYNPSYQAGGLIGHTGEDWGCGYGTPISSQYDGLVYKTLTVERPSNDGTGFTGVFMIVDDGIELFEWLVGHCDPLVVAGQTIQKGQEIATESNHGTVYSGNLQITLAMQKAGDHRGAHRHYQKRPLKKVPSVAGSCLTKQDGGFYTDTVNFYQIWDYENGFNGCIPPSKSIFDRDLFLGSSGYDVYVLQRILRKLGLFSVEPTGTFGPVTRSSVASFQKTRGINPLFGYVGQRTRTELNKYITNPTLSAE